METTAMSIGRGAAGRKRVDGKAKTQSSATTAAKGGEANRRKAEKSHSPVPQSAWQNYLERPPPRGGVRQDEKETSTKKI